MSKRRRALALVALASLAGCDGRSAPSAPPSRGLPPLDPGAVAPSAAPLPRAEHPPIDGDPHGLANPHAAGDPHAARGPHGMPAGHGADPHGEGALGPATPADIPFDPKTVVAGVLKLDPKLKDKVKAGEVIYLVARGPGAAGAPGPVVAVKRIEVGAFPIEFQLDSRDAMMVGTQMKAPLTLTARVDKDGDAMTKEPGDVTGTATVKGLPAAKLTLLLDTTL